MTNRIDNEAEQRGGENEWGDQPNRPVEVAAADLSEETLDELIKAFIVPDGTDYGMTAAAYEAKERQTRKQIASGSLRIIFDAESDTTMLMGSQEWRALEGSKPARR